MTEIRSKSPEAANAFNEQVFPVLELYSNVVTSNGKWNRMDLKTKKATVKSMLTLAKRETMEALEDSYIDKDTKASLIFQIGNSGAKKSDVRKVLKAFDVREKELWDLSVSQLNLALAMIKDTRTDQRNITEEVGLE
jgi:hypothetical protein